MGDYWDFYGTGDAWCDKFGNHVDPRTFENEDALHAAGYHHVTQAGALDWIARELGNVPHETITGWRSAAGTRTPWFSDCIPVESMGRDA